MKKMILLKMIYGGTPALLPWLQQEVWGEIWLIILALKQSDNNCTQVESYEVKYQNLGDDEVLQETILRTDLSDGRIILDDFPKTET